MTNISRSKGNQIMKFGLLIEYNIYNQYIHLINIYSVYIYTDLDGNPTKYTRTV